MCGCGTSKKVSVINYYSPVSISEEIKIIGPGQKIPDNAKLVGSVKIGETGFTTKCTYKDVISDAENQARSMGGNLIYIKKHKEPDLWSSCHRIEAEIYKETKQ